MALLEWYDYSTWGFWNWYDRTKNPTRFLIVLCMLSPMIVGWSLIQVHLPTASSLILPTLWVVANREASREKKAKRKKQRSIFPEPSLN